MTSADADRLPPYDTASRLIHLLLAASGIAALLTGDLADDYKRAAHTGFDVHAWLGLSLAAALGARLVWGVVGPRAMRFAAWVPFTAERLRRVLEDGAGLLRFRLPERAGHEGLAGLVQTAGLLAFLWMAATGTLLFVYLEPGQRATGWLDVLKDAHEAGESILYVYLVLHVGAVVVHSVAGRPVWRRMAPWAGKANSR